MSERTPRVHLQPSPNPYPLEMIERWEGLLELLTIFPALTSHQVARLLFLGLPNLQGNPRSDGAAQKAANHKCLRRLKDLGLVAVKPIPRPQQVMARWELNYLTKSGYKLLQETRASHSQAPPLPYRNPNLITPATMTTHTMAVLEAGVAAVAATLRHEDVVLDTWWDDMQIRSLSKTGQLHWPMEPDGLLILRHGATRQPYFIEVDLGTESIDSNRPNSWRTKMDKYKFFFHVQRATDPLLGSLPQPQILTITPSSRRLENLKHATGNAGGRSAYWFTLSEYTQPPFGFFDAVFERLAVEGHHSILERFSS